MTADIDLTAVDRRIHGHATPLTADEQRYTTHLLTDLGQSAANIADIIGVSNRTIHRWRKAPPFLPPDTDDAPAAWRDSASCREVGAEFFFAPDPDEETDEDPLYSAARARAICARCPVRDQCLDDAMAREGTADRHSRAGVWGGLTPSQRAALARARRRKTAA